MSRRLRLPVLAALAFSGACPATEPNESRTATPAAAPAQAPGAQAATEGEAKAPPALVPLLQPTPSSPSPLLPPLLAPPAPKPAEATARTPAPADALTSASTPPLAPGLPGAPNSDPAASAAEIAPAVAPAAVASSEPFGPPASTATTPAMRSGADVFSRLRRGLSPNACDAGSNSLRWRQRYAGSPAAFSRRVESVLPLIDFVSSEVERAGLPEEFAFIPLVESWYTPGAIGPGGPAGMWQMIGTTAQNHGIHIRAGYDGRLSPVESTRAALSYLKVLKDMFGGDWQAMVMAYNAGEGRMQNAMRRAGSRTTNASQRKPHGLSNITYDYVDKLQALSCLVTKPQLQGVRLPVEARFEPLVPLLMEAQVGSLDEFARAHGKDPALLRRLNPGFRDGRVIDGVPRLVLSPPGASASLALAAVAPPPVPSMVAIAAAGKPAVPDPMVAAAPTDASMAAPVLVPVSMPVEASAPPPASAGALDAPPAMHEVREGDTLASIADFYHLPVEQIRRANNLGRDALLRPGQRLRLVP